MKIVIIDFSSICDVCAGDLAGTVENFLSELSKKIPIEIIRFHRGLPLSKVREALSDKFIPLFVCKEVIDFSVKTGAVCPYEFIVTRNDLLPETKNDSPREYNAPKFRESPKKILEYRINALLKVHKGGITIQHLRDWFWGMFKKYLFLDPDTHGAVSSFDFEWIRDYLRGSNESQPKGRGGLFFAICEACCKANYSETEKNVRIIAQKFLKRFECEKSKNRDGQNAGGEFDALLYYKQLLETLYVPEFGAIRTALTALEKKTSEELKKEFAKIIFQYRPDVSIEHGVDLAPNVSKDIPPRVSYATGGRALFTTPTGEINVLVIDNKPKDVKKRLEDWCEKNKFSDAFKDRSYLENNLSKALKFTYVTVNTDQTSEHWDNAVFSKFKKLRDERYSFDLILIGHVFDSKSRYPIGQHIFRYAGAYFPDVPIALYTMHTDMVRIMGAITHGAKWVFKKGEEEKFLRHFMALKRLAGWYEEWCSIQELFRFRTALSDDDVDEGSNNNQIREFLKNHEWRYLVYKHFERHPGVARTVELISAGLSNAQTFKVTKGIMLDKEYLQSSYIVKIDLATSMRLEYERYSRFIKPYIANRVGRIEKEPIVLHNTCASIMYTYAGHADSYHKLESFHEFMKRNVRHESSCDYEIFRRIFDVVFDEILPRIHKVTPNREYGDPRDDGVNRNKFYAQILEPESIGSTFPNPYFNEFQIKDFFKSYLVRMSPWREMDFDNGYEFVSQPEFCESQLKFDEKKNSNANPFVFHGIHQPMDENGHENGRWILEAYDQDWKLVWFKGDVPNLVARYRQLLSPGQTLWVKDNTEKQNVSQGDGQYQEKWYKDRIEKDGLGQFDSFDDEFEQAAWNRPNELCRIQDELLKIAQKVGSAMSNDAPWGKKVHVGGCVFSSPLGIVHGDLNLANIMLDTRSENLPTRQCDGKWSVADVWLIDFARTRRDLITHDFNVAFTSTLFILLEDEFVKDATYKDKLDKYFPMLVRHSFTDKDEGVEDIPDAFRNEPRYALAYRMLRRIRMAAIAAHVSPHMYLLTTALACSYVIKICLTRKDFLKASAMAVSVKICHKILKKDWIEEFEHEATDN